MRASIRLLSVVVSLYVPLSYGQQAVYEAQHFEVSQQQDAHQPLAVPRIDPGPVEVDLTGVYFHLRHHNSVAAEQELQRLKSQYPGWQPPTELLTLMEQTRRAQRARPTSEPSYDYEKEIAYIAALTPQQASGVWDQRLIRLEQEVQQRRDVWGANRLGRAYLLRAEYDPAERIFLYSVSVRETIRGREGLAQVYYHKAQEAIRNNQVEQAWLFKEKSRDYGYADIYIEMAGLWSEQQAYLEALASLQEAEDSNQKQNALAQVYLQLAWQAISLGQIEQAIDYLHLSKEQGNEQLFNQVGWSLYDQQDYATAEQVFMAPQPNNADNVYGALLSLRALGHETLALERACYYQDLSETLAAECLTGVEAQIVERYQAKDYQNVVVLEPEYNALTQANKRPLAPIMAWSWFNLNQPSQAYSRFDHLLADAPQEMSYAQAMVEILKQQANPQQTQQARQTHPLVDQLLSQEQTNQAWYRKQFDLVQRQAASSKPALSGREDWATYTGVFWQERSGTKGLSYLNSLTPFIGATRMLDDVRLDLKLSAPNHVSGKPSQAADFADRPQNDIREAIGSTTSWQPQLSGYWERENFNFIAQIGSTPVTAPVEQTAIGRLDLKWFGPNWIAQGRIFRRSVDESLLSITGTEKTTSDQAWGRVVDQGGYIGFTWLIDELRAASFNLENSSLSGKDVKENRRLSYRADLAWNLAGYSNQDWDYLRVGPYVSGLAYQYNLSYFTSGHGGYYSPQSNLNLGLFLSLLSAEGREQQYKLQASVGYEQAKNDAVARFPLNPDNTQFQSSSSAGLAGNIQYQHMWMLNPNWMLGGFAEYGVSPDFNNKRLGALVRYSFAKRNSVISADLPLYRPND